VSSHPNTCKCINCASFLRMQLKIMTDRFDQAERELAETKSELAQLKDRYECNTAIMRARTQEMERERKRSECILDQYSEHMLKNEKENCHNYGCMNEPGPLKPVLTKEGDIGAWICEGECQIWKDPGA
jgi:hypothetical protein